jgi:DNA/RNA-binding domain of Phe-tRNA-synthetase-like protein
MVTIKKSEKISDKIKSLKLGLVTASSIKVLESDEKFATQLEQLEKELAEKFHEKAPSQDPVISATRRMYRQVGWEPTKYRPSSEALIRRLIQGKGLYRINNIVDYGNLVSARFHIPMGLYDLTKIKGDIIVDIGREDESYEGISKTKISATGKIILRDQYGVFGNPTADSKRTSISKQTDNIFAIFFAAASIDESYLLATINALAGYYSIFSEGGILTEVTSL